ncbi:hypothetical protein I5Q34_06015 [Streptomyces sp. AV19]|uniref:hypothetical protein n=1 Tax=Streptomyces sp. AV19 TaxID=2793068 RepID=UPI0018FED6A6|nr:hypothetical protein [Streptomyces sp. AV19]MBH1933853.1 hypothetical protein [Streptomyces sp. AV19]MDG4533205.1 hypothetical protein [Streptomyces sp. AV19]
MDGTLAAVGWLLLRLGVGGLFLNAAWACGKDRAAIRWTRDATAVVFPRFAGPLALLGIAVMALGGLSVLLGAYGRIGGAALALFLVPATLIHLRGRAEATALAGRLAPELSAGLRPSLAVLGASAAMAHYSSALKNVALFFVALCFVAAGTGPYSLAAL